jgi:hypothetical protein
MAPLEPHPHMTTEELDRIDRALLLLILRDCHTARARDVALQYNARIHEARSRLASARDLLLRSHPISSETEIELSAYAVMYAGERERIVRQWGLSLTRDVA